jgi:hypothetical protein
MMPNSFQASGPLGGFMSGMNNALMQQMVGRSLLGQDLSNQIDAAKATEATADVPNVLAAQNLAGAETAGKMPYASDIGASAGQGAVASNVAATGKSNQEILGQKMNAYDTVYHLLQSNPTLLNDPSSKAQVNSILSSVNEPPVNDVASFAKQAAAVHSAIANSTAFQQKSQLASLAPAATVAAEKERHQSAIDVANIQSDKAQAVEAQRIAGNQRIAEIRAQVAARGNDRFGYLMSTYNAKNPDPKLVQQLYSSAEEIVLGQPGSQLNDELNFRDPKAYNDLLKEKTQELMDRRVPGWRSVADQMTAGDVPPPSAATAVTNAAATTQGKTSAPGAGNVTYQGQPVIVGKTIKVNGKDRLVTRVLPNGQFALQQ